jgi:DNA-binding transcriptional MerR regulator
MAQLVPIGRFSDMTRLSVKALRRYDELGLLAPAYVDPSSGYRYYAMSQARRAEAVRRLRALDLPLEEIKRMLAAAPADVTGMLAAHQERLRAERDRHDRMLATVAQLITGKESLMNYPITIDTLRAQTVAALRCHTSLATVGADITAGFQTLMTALAAAGQKPACAPFLIMHDIIDAETDGDIDICVPVRAPLQTDDRVRVDRLAETTAAVTVHQGRYDEIAPAYHALTTWITEHGHEIAGPPRETYLNDPTSTDETDLLTQVAWPIR